MPVVKWGARDRIVAIDGASILAGGNAVSSEVAESDYRYADVELAVSFSSAPTANTTLSAYLLYADDSGVYETGSDTVDPLRMPLGCMVVSASTGNQVNVIELAMIPPRAFKVLITNDTNRTAVASVKVRRYNEVLE